MAKMKDFKYAGTNTPVDQNDPASMDADMSTEAIENPAGGSGMTPPPKDIPGFLQYHLSLNTITQSQYDTMLASTQGISPP